MGISGIVLAGGQSQRMGRNKAFLELAGESLVSRVLGKLTRLCDELIISANEMALYAGLPARVVPDLIPERGALGGIHAGLSAMRNQWGIVVACDMPFLSLPLLRYMTALAPTSDVVVPRSADGFEPLHAVYSKNCVGAIAQVLDTGPQRVIAFYDRVNTVEISEQAVRLYSAELAFFNVNRAKDWVEAQRMYGERSK